MVPQVGVLKQFAGQGWLKPLDKKVQSAVGANFAEVWQNYGSVDGTLYGLYFKAAHKSTVWYSPEALEQAGVAEPRTYDEMLKNGRTISDSGLAAFSVAGQDGWTLTDWFENVYLSQAGPEKYDALAAHEIKWTDPTVVDALTTLGKLFKDKQLIAGGQKGALNTDFPARWRRSSDPRPRPPWSTRATSWPASPRTSSAGPSAPTPSSSRSRRSAAVRRPWSAAATRPSSSRTARTARPAWRSSSTWRAPRPRPSGPRRAASLPEQEARPVLLRRRRHPRHRRVPGEGRRLGPLRHVRPGPAAFGGTKGAGEWKILQDFLRDPSDPAKTAAELEKAAAKAYGN